MAPCEAEAEAGGDDAGVAAGFDAGLATALHDVARNLAAPGLSGRERMRLLRRQAELGDLRDELELRARRRLASRR